MKLIIDIPEEDYKIIKDMTVIAEPNDFRILVKNGTPIPDNATEQIRAEIYKKSVQMHFDGNFYIKIDDVFQIIDKYTKGEDE